MLGTGVRLSLDSILFASSASDIGIFFLILVRFCLHRFGLLVVIFCCPGLQWGQNFSSTPYQRSHARKPALSVHYENSNQKYLDQIHNGDCPSSVTRAYIKSQRRIQHPGNTNQWPFPTAFFASISFSPSSPAKRTPLQTGAPAIIVARN